jgi:hypothetical protein
MCRLSEPIIGGASRSFTGAWYLFVGGVLMNATMIILLILTVTLALAVVAVLMSIINSEKREIRLRKAIRAKRHIKQLGTLWDLLTPDEKAAYLIDAHEIKNK